jgi:hypothetical protein
MTVEYANAGAISETTSVPFPTSIAANNKLLLFVATFLSGSIPSVSASGFVEVPGSPSALSGSSGCRVLEKTATGSESGNLTISFGSTPTGSIAFIARFTKTLGEWSVTAGGTGSFAGGSTAYSITTGTAVERLNGDRLVSCAVLNSGTLRLWDNEQIDGAGINAVMNEAAHSAQSFQLHCATAQETASSTGTATHTGTLNSGVAGKSIVVRLRDATRFSGWGMIPIKDDS